MVHRLFQPLPSQMVRFLEEEGECYWMSVLLGITVFKDFYSYKMHLTPLYGGMSHGLHLTEIVSQALYLCLCSPTVAIGFVSKHCMCSCHLLPSGLQNKQAVWLVE